jgi:AI-2 transport protein TqsA
MTKDVKDSTGSGLTTACLVILAALALGVALLWMRPVLVPLVLAILVSYLVAPVVDFVQLRLKVPRAIAITAALLLAAGGMALVVTMISSSAGALAAKSDLYQEKLVGWGDDAVELAEKLGLPVEIDMVKKQMSELPVGQIIGGTLNKLVDMSSTFFLVLIFVIYLVAGRQPRQESKGMYHEIDLKVRRYLGVKVMLSGITGILVALILWIIGLDLAIVFGVLAFLLNFIPSIGSVIATLLPLPLALVQFDSSVLITLAIVIPGAIQMTVGNVIEPKMMGTSLNLHPITILLSLIFWGMLWGMPGMVLAAPITAVVKIILDRIETTRPIGQLLGGKLPE